MSQPGSLVCGTSIAVPALHSITKDCTTIGFTQLIAAESPAGMWQCVEPVEKDAG